MTIEDCTFGPFTLRPGRRQILEAGQPIPLGGRAFDLLLALVEARGRIVAKHELLRTVWPGAVEANNLTVTISALRRALHEQPDQPYIRTVSGRGYQFVAPLGERPATRPEPAPYTDLQPGIAVLPFASVGSDPAQDHFGQAIAEDIVAELSRNRWLTVIASQSSFSPQHAGADSRAIARQFGVRYVLEGSIQTAQDCVRVKIQLIDAHQNRHLASERYDRRLTDIFAVQDEITALIVETVRPALYEAEQDRSIRRHPDSIDAWAAYQRGVWHLSRPDQPGSADARIWFDRAIALDPRFAPGYYGRALVDLHDGSAHLPEAPPDWQPRGERLALKAVALDPRDSGAHSILGLARMVRGDHAGALEATRQALELNPNDATAHGTRGAALVFDGRPRDGLHALATSLRLSPRDPRLRIRQAHVGLGHYFAQDHPAAEAQARAIIRDWPTYAFGPRLLAMVLAETGRLPEAAAAIAAAIALCPAPFDDFSHHRMPWYRPQDHARVLQALKAAGWTAPA